MKDNLERRDSEISVFDTFPWWDPRDVLLQITPARLQFILSVSGPLAGQRVLDVGCGGGYLAEPLAEAGAIVTGIDVSEPALETARHHASARNLSIEYLRAPAEDMPFPDESFDLVTALDVLEHVADLERTIDEISRVLKPDGKLIYDTNNRTVLSWLVMILFGENLWPGGPPKGTHNWRKFIKPAELVRLLTEHGITNRETRGFYPVGIDLQGRLKMRLGRFQGISYVGYGIKIVTQENHR